MEIFDILKAMTENELLSRHDNTYHRYLKKAKLPFEKAILDNIDRSEQRRLNEALLSQLSDDEYIKRHRNILIFGACGTGKTFLGSALGNNACRHLHRVLYTEMYELFEETNSERAYKSDTQGLSFS